VYDCLHLDQRVFRPTEEVQEVHRETLLQKIANERPKVLQSLYTDVLMVAKDESALALALDSWAVRYNFTAHFCGTSLADWIINRARNTVERWQASRIPSGIAHFTSRSPLQWAPSPTATSAWPSTESEIVPLAMEYRGQWNPYTEKPAVAKKRLAREAREAVNKWVDAVLANPPEGISPSAVKPADHHFVFLAVQIVDKLSGRKVARLFNEPPSSVLAGLKAAKEAVGFWSQHS